MKRVLLFLPQGFEMIEAAAFIDVIAWNQIEGNGQTELKTCGFKREIAATGGQRMIAELLIDDANVDDFDALAIPGGFEEYGYYTEAYDDRLSDLIRSFHGKKKPIFTVCTAALALGKSGILAGKRATTYDKNPKRHEELKEMGAVFMEGPFAKDGGIITSCNPSTAIEVAFLLLEELTGKINTDIIKNKMGFKN
jgi:4-methyl-5(b-hydroxyethyl)-thiazole monophosphate biosynthesis